MRKKRERYGTNHFIYNHGPCFQIESVSLIKPSPLIPKILCKSSAQITPLPISAINHTVLVPLKRNFKRKTHGLNVTVVRLNQLSFRRICKKF